MPSPDALADAAGRRVDARVLEGDVRGPLGDGVFVSPGSLRLADVSGSGILIARGPLELSGTSTFAGILVALGDVRSELGSDLRVDGAAMVGNQGAVVSLRGSGHVAYDPRIIARVDAAFPGLLPRQARITGWREEPEVDS